MTDRDFASAVRFSEKVSASFDGQRFDLLAETYETTWGFKSTSDKYFKISNRDLEDAFSDIVSHWAEWSGSGLNVNSRNPDVTLTEFSKSYFSPGAHKDLAEVQRRGFLHLINAIAFSARHDGPFGAAEWDSALTKADYEAALEKISKLSENARVLSRSSPGTPPKPTSGPRVEGGDNILFYGAPGTGKSHDVGEMVGSEKRFVTVFHPDMQNSDFAGTLKPGTDAEGEVTYAFRPGPFSRAVAYAWAHPQEKVYLVIEELNRAVAAAVFGELFQLLDRTGTGASRYEVDFPSPEFEQWFVAESGTSAQSLSIPSNLWLLATMNSADQGVYPLDTAFRRRWRQNYLPIDYAKAPTDPVTLAGDAGKITVPWRTFVAGLNRLLVDKVDIGEDRLIGPRFVDVADLVGGKLPGKLLIYLWDDLLRHHGRPDLFRPDVKTFGELHSRMLNGKPVFNQTFLDELAGGNAEGPDAATGLNPE